MKAQLRGAVVQELTRLEELIDPRDRQTTDVSLTDVLAPLVRAQRETGQRIEMHLDGVRARARAYDLATAVQNLLVNASRHASGTEVTVSAQASMYDVRLASTTMALAYQPRNARRSSAAESEAR